MSSTPLSNVRAELLDLPPQLRAQHAPAGEWRTLWAALPLAAAHRGWLTAVVVTALLSAVLEPIQGVIVKRAVDSLGKGGVGAANAFSEQVPLYLAVLAGLAILSFFEKCLKGLYDPYVIFALQRAYLTGRRAEDLAEDITRLQYDCVAARKNYEVLVRDFPRLTAIAVGVLFVQWSLAASWLPALLAVVAPVAAAVLILGPRIVRSNADMFRDVAGVSACAARQRMGDLEQTQQALHGSIRVREAWMGASEVLMQLLLWSGCLLVVLVARYWPGTLVPADVTPGDLALFIVNAQLLSKPLIESGKAFNKYCSNAAALRRALHLDGGP